MILPLKRTVSLTVALVTLLLAGMLAAGIRQYQLHRHQQEIIRQSGQLLFQFSLIREHILESIVNGGRARLQPVSGEVESFHASVAQIMTNPAIPDEYKLAFANQVDLPGLVLLLRNVQGDLIPPVEARRLNEITRTIGERLVLFDRMVLEHAKRQVVDFQTAVIGLLALAVVGLTTVLFSGYRRLARPLWSLLRQIREVREGRRQAILDSGNWQEVRTLATAASELLGEIRRLEQEGAGQRHLLRMSREVLKALSRGESAEELYQGMSKALLAHPGYCLVWLGVPEKEGDLLPVAADGSTTMTGQECKECMAVLLSEDEVHDGGQDQALAALQSAGPVVRRNILAGMPKGPVKNTPLAEGEVSCASVPLVIGGEVLGVINLYSLEPRSFERAEVELLLLLSQLAAARLRAMAANRHPGESPPTGEEAAGKLALEINNMCNGIINYAQLLTDEWGDVVPSEQNQLLARIIREGERIAALVGPLAGSRPAEGGF